MDKPTEEFINWQNKIKMTDTFEARVCSTDPITVWPSDFWIAWLAYLKGRDNKPVAQVVMSPVFNPECDECNAVVETTRGHEFKYCPECGAKLDWSEIDK